MPVTAMFRKSKNSVFNFLLSLDRNGKSKRIKVQLPVGNTFDDMNLTQFEIMPYQINISTLTQYSKMFNSSRHNQILPGPFCFDFYYIELPSRLKLQ